MPRPVYHVKFDDVVTAILARVQILKNIAVRSDMDSNPNRILNENLAWFVVKNHCKLLEKNSLTIKLWSSKTRSARGKPRRFLVLTTSVDASSVESRDRLNEFTNLDSISPD
jgi:hypothetical protein